MTTHPQRATVSVQDLSKRFEIYAKPADLLWETLTRRTRHKSFWALRDVTFDVRPGEVMGVVGRNGAGKSTLLKILAGTLDYTSGSVAVGGRVSAILELGTGFHGEYTGRKNIVMGGLCLGMTRQEIENKIDWIIEFSELGEFIDMPFKTYSTGMQTRLTFSTAVCVDPDILIVDEALSVGDAKFRSKCYEQIIGFKQRGKAIILVSHDLNTIGAFCDRAILLDQGRVIETGTPQHVTRVYYHMMFGTMNYMEKVEPQPTELKPVITARNTGSTDRDQDTEDILLKAAVAQLNAPSDDDSTQGHPPKEARVIDFGILDERGTSTALLESGQPCTLFVRAVFLSDVDEPRFGFMVRDFRGVDMCGMPSKLWPEVVPPHRRGDVLEGQMRVTMWLTNGDYFLSVGVGNPQQSSFDFRCDALHFKVSTHSRLHHSSVVNLDPKLSFRTLGRVDTNGTWQKQPRISLQASRP